jgi:capsular exopolysaccharide synthesis family protein
MKSDIDFRELLQPYRKNWKWFVLSVVICLALVFLQLRYATPVYKVTSKIKIEDNQKGGPEINVLQELDLYSSENTKILDEIEVIKSRTNLQKVIEGLKLNLNYSIVGHIKTTDLYGKQRPFAINFLSNDTLLNKNGHQFFVRVKSKSQYGYSESKDGPEKIMTFGESIQTPVGELVLVPSKEIKFIGDLIKVDIIPLNKAIESLIGSLQIVSMDEKSSIVTVSLSDTKTDRAMDIVDELVNQYNKSEIEYKKAVADRTSQFIDDRIAEIYNNLSDVDETAESYKERRGIADLSSQSNVAFQQSAQSEAQLQDVNIQLSIANSMGVMLDDQKGFDIIPTNVGISDPSIDQAAIKYNELVNQRNRLLESSNEQNPVIVQLDKKLESLKLGIKSSLNNISNNLNLQANSLSKQLSQINSRIYSAPSSERALRDISRQQQTTESLYLYLLQKREESQISFASTSPKSKVIDNAYLTSSVPISPKPKILYLLALLAGVVIPSVFIFLIGLFDNKVKNLVELQKLAGNENVVLAELPKVGKKSSKVVLKDDRSVLAEALRIFRTNLDFVLKSKKGKKNNIVFITSTTSGEGKTFVSSNLSMILASTGKKVLLIGADIRNPKLYTFFSGENVDKLGRAKRDVKIGLSEYLSDASIGSNQLINEMLVHTNTVDVIYSGKIPPNPAELLMSDRMGVLIEEMSEMYDYVIVDTAPLMVVTDTLLISSYASEVIYVTRSGVTETRAIEFPLKLKEEGKLPNLSFVVNDVKENNLGYGGKYGYGYGMSHKKWWQFS